MQIALLGPLAARDDTGAVIDVAGARLRTLLARLAVDADRPVAVSTLVHAVWGDDPPAEATNALQTLVSRLRRALGGIAPVTQSPSGYRLAADPGDTDAGRFRSLAADGAAALRQGRAADALVLLDDALALWRGLALADTRDLADDLAARAGELDDLRLTASLDRVEAQLLVDPSRVDAGELERAVADHPLHERLAATLIRALAAAGRTPEALQAYEALRGRLADELGVDPSAELRELHLTLLRGDTVTADPAGPDGDRGAAAPRRTNLKAQLTSFVGRDDEVARIAKSLEANRLVTLVGPGGAGKTRLAAEAADRILDTAADGVWLVELAAVTSGADVPQAVLASVGLRDIHVLDRRAAANARDAMTRLRDGFAQRSAILLLDNCEHVIDAGARLAEQLLGECPGLRVLATSREPLGITGETLLAVPPLALPAAGATAVDALGFPAVRLFVDRATAVRPDFVLRDEDVPDVVEIVSRLDGLPLAIELAAARVRTMPLPDVAARLSDRFRLLTGGSRTAMPRHRTLRAVVEWSWGLLDDVERGVVERLAVFPAGITAASAEAVCADLLDPADVPDCLASLIDKSLLQPVGEGRRVRMLETIREYGADRLAERGELGAARDRHATHFAAVLAEAEPYLTTAGQLPWFDLLRAERENIVAALRFRCETGDADAALRIAVPLSTSAMLLGEHAEISVWTADALDVPGATDEGLRLIARSLLALHSTTSGRIEDVAQLSTMVEELRDSEVDFESVMVLLRPAMAFLVGDVELSRRWLEQNLEGGDEWTRAATRMFLANFHENSGDLVGMRRETEAALVLFRELGERWGLGNALRGLAQLLTFDGDLAGARAAYEEALALMREMRSTEDEVVLYQRLADLALRQDDVDAAVRYVEAAHRSAALDRSPLESALTTAMRGEIEWRMGQHAAGRALADEALVALHNLPVLAPSLGHIHAFVLTTAARIEFESGEVELARAHLRTALTTALGTRDHPVVAMVGVLLADVLRSDGDARFAAELLGACSRLRGAEDLDAFDVAAARHRLVAALDDTDFGRAYDEGRALDGVAALALVGQGQDRLR
ncbi:Predicted ATPase [Jatrophihabitans endophyticus]|uniref:Predicted ATPase n=1 Tax=Jatrophihabitans endophyticus TaxID=1206085 RepID=A0A1M5PJG1_9ACTN|nr:BTAD domain-containing putative transcriptional regulator [Jatrophihabitans endophyticus]SHH01908.1 Predicted ATPase [Jatrophihabitans endophyticus]